MILHWKRILREAGIVWTDVERLTGDTEGGEGVGGKCGNYGFWITMENDNYSRHVRRSVGGRRRWAGLLGRWDR